MSIKEITTQLYDLSIAGYFNREKFTKARLETYINTMLRTGDSLIMEVALPDGWWLCEVQKVNGAGYDYYIPDTREQETALKRKLTQGAGA